MKTGRNRAIKKQKSGGGVPKRGAEGKIKAKERELD